MIQKIKITLLTLIAPFMVTLAPASVAVVYAQSPNIGEGLCKGADDLQIGPGEPCPATDGEEGINNLIRRIVNIISVIVGIIAVIMIIFGGFRYITSGGSAEKVTAAKNTILYALIGLIIVALAQVIVRFVLRETTQAV
jgi:hypothetical protein